MGRQPKYKARFVYWDSLKRVVINKFDAEAILRQNNRKLPKHIWRFDSQHEFKVYLELVRIFGADRIERQYHVNLFFPGKCYPNGKTWKCDFAIDNSPNKDEWTHFVEAKGAFLPEFATTLALVEDKETEIFDNLFIVFNGKPPLKNRVIKSLLKTDFKDHLLSLKELEKLTTLPCPQ